MRHGSLFSGIGGFDLAASWMGWENVFQVEKDEWCQRVLAKNFPNSKRYGDIKEFDGTPYRGSIDILTGGFPCQPFSTAGKRKGKEDDRFLWPEMLRTIREVRPQWVVGENVAGIIGMALDQVLTEMEDSGYHTETYIIPACAVNAWHRRDRVWIVAKDAKRDGRDRCEREEKPKKRRLGVACAGVHERLSEESIGVHANNTQTERRRKNGGQILSQSESKGSDWPNWETHWLEVATRLCGMDDGLPERVGRLSGYGNAIVPQVAYEIFKAIEMTDSQMRMNRSNG